MNYLDALPERYRVILCDVWGVVHDGVALYPGAAMRLLQWRGEGRFVVLITNAPRTAEAVEQQLERIGLPGDAWDGIATSGEAGIAALKLLGKPVGFRRHPVRPRSPRRAGNRDQRRGGLHRPRLRRPRWKAPGGRRLCPRSRALGRTLRADALPQSRPAGDPRRRSRGLCGRDRRRLSGARRAR